MTYSVAFDAHRATYSFVEVSSSAGSRHALGVAALLIVVALVLVARRHRLGKRNFVLALCGIVLTWLVASEWLVPTHTVSLRTVGLSVVTGIVRDLTPMPLEGHADERFCVQTVCFHYSDFAQTGGFNHTSTHGGPIKEGLPVRVTYAASPRNNVILKLEIQE